MKIKVIVKQPNKEPEIKEIENDYNTISTICEGLIDVVLLPVDNSINIICNDEFLYNGMEANIVTPENTGVLAGPIIFTGFNENTGDSISLTEKQIQTSLKYIKRNQVINMSIARAFQYSQVIQPLQQLEDKLGVNWEECYV